MQGAKMPDDMQLETERILKISFQQQSALLRHFARTDLVARIKILAEKTGQFHKLRQENGSVEKSVLEYCAFIMAIQKKHDEQSLRKKSFVGLALEEIRLLSQKKADACPRTDNISFTKLSIVYCKNAEAFAGFLDCLQFTIIRSRNLREMMRRYHGNLLTIEFILQYV